jgi:HK97 family phage prohead protease
VRIIDPRELRANPQLVRELRAQPGEHAERRYAPMRHMETRANDDGTFRIGGLAAVYDELSVNLGGFRERIDRGAFRKVLGTNPDVRCLFNHDLNYLLGRTSSGTLRLKEVPSGLDYDADAPATSYASDLRVLMDRGDINQSSFAFRVARGGDSWDEDGDTGALIRTIHEFSDLYDVSPVTDPAYPQTTSGARSTPDEQPQHDDLADEPELVAEGDVQDRSGQQTDPLQGDQEYLVAARQRRLRQWQHIARR